MLTPAPNYCYKKDGIWHQYVPIGDSSIQIANPVSFALSNNDEPLLSYSFISHPSYNDFRGVKYAQGDYYGGIKEIQSRTPKIEGQKLEVYPNPFKDATGIKIQIPSAKYQTNSKKQSAPPAMLKIYDATGCLVRSFNHLTNHHFNHVTWLGDDDAGQQVPAGVYFISLETKEYRETKKILRLK